MRRNIQNLLVRPPFYDALNGAFEPSCDPEKRQHTLARLAFAAYAKGEYQPPRAVMNGRLYPRIYEPSWAPGVVATALSSSCGPVDRLVALELQAAGGSLLSVKDLTTHYGFALEIDTQDRNPVLIKGLDGFQESTRETVAHAAATFFNT